MDTFQTHKVLTFYDFFDAVAYIGGIWAAFKFTMIFLGSFLVYKQLKKLIERIEIS